MAWKMMRGILVGVLVVVTWLLSVPASAGPIADGVDALTGFFGSRSYSYTGGGYSLTAEVDFAVYEPLAYPGSVPLSGADDYVYAYQIFTARRARSALDGSAWAWRAG